MKKKMHNLSFVLILIGLFVLFAYGVFCLFKWDSIVGIGSAIIVLGLTIGVASSTDKK